MYGHGWAYDGIVVLVINTFNVLKGHSVIRMAFFILIVGVKPLLNSCWKQGGYLSIIHRNTPMG